MAADVLSYTRIWMAKVCIVEEKEQWVQYQQNSICTIILQAHWVELRISCIVLTFFIKWNFNQINIFSVKIYTT
jgi:hypothetical protein